MDLISKCLAKKYVANWYNLKLINSKQGMTLMNKVSRNQFKDLEDFVCYAAITCKIEYEYIPAEYQHHASLINKIISKINNPYKMLSTMERVNEKTYNDVIFIMNNDEVENVIKKESLPLISSEASSVNLKNYLDSSITIDNHLNKLKQGL